MAFTSGTRLGPYEIQFALGAGGMGVVYRALDTNLGRQVAIKVLPDAFAVDAERLARFEREAKTLASLNHPNIAQIYGLEKADGIRALVMELVEGPTLAERIAQGPIPVDEALPIAKQIAEALEAAHEQSIIHRDLKPANIKLRPDGVVKVLDFGLAKALDTMSSGSIDATAAPTITSPAMMTGVGMLLGTAAYMSPEQAKGKKVDRRADIWAFGCVLYEMLTGGRAFAGEEISETLAAVIRGEPDWTALPPKTPAAVRRLLRRCFIKDPKLRLSDAAALRLDIDDARTPEPLEQHIQRPAGDWRRVPPYAVVASVIAALGVAAWWFIGRPEAPPAEPMRFTVDLPANVVLTPNAVQRVVISSNGRRIAYPGLDGNGGNRVYVRSLDQLEPVAVRGTEQVGSIFFSPDGEWIGYNQSGVFRKVPVAGGPSAVICEVPTAQGGFRGATWGTAGLIVFATGAARGLMQVSDAGGTPEPLTSPPEGEIHRNPHFLPDGRTVLFVIQRMGEPDRIAVVSLDAPEPRVLLQGNSPKFSSSGHLVFLRDDALWATTFDATRLVVGQRAVPVLEGIEVGVQARYDVASTGALVYSPAGAEQAARTLTWVDRQGVEEPIPAPPRTYAAARLAPDGARVALDLDDQDNDVWMWDLRGQTLTRMTFDREADGTPVWTPDGRRIAYRSNREGGTQNLFWRAADGTGPEERLAKSGNTQTPMSFSPDGKWLLFDENTVSSTLWDIMSLAIDGSRTITPLVQTQFRETGGDISPDGRWVAYTSDESGAPEVFVRPFPNVQGGRWQVSTNGGTHPAWSRTGGELFYLNREGRLVSAVIEGSAGFRASTPRPVLERRYYQLPDDRTRSYDVAHDGRRFLMIKQATGPEGARAQLIVVLNWQEELKRLVPAN